MLLFSTGCANYVSNMHREFDSYEKKRNRSIQSSTGETIDDTKGDKRYSADDFKDRDTSNSLWVGNGKENFFSSGGVRKEKGDLVTINVFTKLKNLIAGEISRMYPSTNKDKKSQTPESSNKNSKNEEVSQNSGETIQDKISVIVTKEVRDNHLILTGRKQLIFNDNRHLIEIQALVHRKDISTDDSLDSSRIIQSSIKVLR